MSPLAVLIALTFLQITTQNEVETTPAEEETPALLGQPPPEVAPVASAPADDVPPTTAPPNVIPRTCTSNENVCPSCDYMALCVDQGDGTFNTLLQKCRENEKCVQGQCVKGATCAQGEFTCHQEGNYPDIYDCTKYHICLPEEGGKFRKETFSCNGTSYDAERRSCGRGLTTEACRKGPVPECTSRVQMGLVPRTKSMYYFCEEKEEHLFPSLFMCPQSFDFNPEQRKCESNKCDECTGGR